MSFPCGAFFVFGGAFELKKLGGTKRAGGQAGSIIICAKNWLFDPEYTTLPCHAFLA